MFAGQLTKRIPVLYAVRLLCAAALIVGVIVFALSGCSHNYRSIVVKTGPTNDIRLAPLWNKLAVAGQFDPETVVLQSLRLEYSEAGVLVALQLDAWTEQHGLMQVGFESVFSSGTQPVQISGGVEAPVPGGTWNVEGCPLAAPIFRAIDLVGPSAMTALLSPAGWGMYAFAPATEYTTPLQPLQPLQPSALAYRWDGGRFVELAPGDELRQFPGGYQYLMGTTEKLVSSSSTDGVSTAQWSGSDQPIFFIVPTPAPQPAE